METTCSSCIHFLPDDGGPRYDRNGDEWSSLCGLVMEYAGDDDESCERYEPTYAALAAANSDKITDTFSEVSGKVKVGM